MFENDEISFHNSTDNEANINQHDLQYICNIINRKSNRPIKITIFIDYIDQLKSRIVQ